jgi:hypothetical protein
VRDKSWGYWKNRSVWVSSRETSENGNYHFIKLELLVKEPDAFIQERHNFMMIKKIFFP